MTTLLTAPADFAQSEFGFAQLGDKRRSARLISIATQLANNPGGTLPQAFPELNDLKAAYRFFKQKGVSFESVIAPHLERTRQNCREPGEYLLIEDTSLLDFSRHTATEDLGFIGTGGRGFDLHSTLAIRVDSWTLEQRPEGTVIGLFHQQCHSPRRKPTGESRHQRLSRPRKSQKWAQSIRVAGGPPPGSRWIYLADRESDFYEPIDVLQQHGVDFVIRAYQDRRLAGEEGGHLREKLAQAPLRGRTTVEVRSRGSEPARTAIVEVRSMRVDLDGPWRPEGWQQPLKNIGVVEVTEVDVPEGVKEPLHWILLTSLPCATWAQAQRVVGYYTARWCIEEYHKALKSGAGVEDSQLRRGDRLQPLIAVLAVVAVRLLSTKMLARSRPESCEAAASFGPEMIEILEKRFGKPKGGWTNRNLLVTTARLGGFPARKSDGMPGWITIWRGWHRLMWMSEGAHLIIK
jgi:Transposase DNA-binding/Transposase DDE domain